MPGGVYYLYVAGDNDTNIYLYMGTDKINFTPLGIVLRRGSSGAWDDRCVANTFVWIENGIWYMLYEAMGTLWQIGLATSPDGKTWTKYEGNPVLTVPVYGCGNPELARVGSKVIKHDGKYYMYYHSQAKVWRAYSTNLKTWTKEGIVEGIIEIPPTFTHGDHALAQLKNKTYLWWSPSNQVNRSWINVVIENRTYSEIISLPPSGYGLFDDGFKEDILSSVFPAYGEPTVIADESAGLIDLWFSGGAGKTMYYVNSKNGLSHTNPVATNLPINVFRPHILKLEEAIVQIP